MSRFVAYCSSFRCTIVLLMSIAMLCVAGTVIPQHILPRAEGTGLASWLLARLDPRDLYHSLWLAVLGGLLCLNLILCMRKNLRPRKTVIPVPRFGDNQGVYIEGEREMIKRRILENAPRTLKFREIEDDSEILLYGEAGAVRRWASLSLHASVLIIFAGMLMGAFGTEGHIELGQGQTTSQMLGTGGSPVDLGFEIRCDEFTVDHYPNGMPREYVSRIAFIEDGIVKKTGELRVNHPMGYRGMRVYQASYHAVSSAVLHVTDGERARFMHVQEGDTLDLDGERPSLHVVKIGENVMNMGPAVKLACEQDGVHYNLWVFKDIDRIREDIPDIFERAPIFNPGLIKPYTFSLMQMTTSYGTGLGVKSDPGAPVVAVGGVLMLLCLLAIFFLPPLRVWLKLESGSGGFIMRTAASLGGKSSEFPPSWIEAIKREGSVR